MKRGVYIPRMHVEMVLFPQNQFEEDNPIYEEGTLEELEVDWLSFKCSSFTHFFLKIGKLVILL